VIVFALLPSPPLGGSAYLEQGVSGIYVSPCVSPWEAGKCIHSRSHATPTPGARRVVASAYALCLFAIYVAELSVFTSYSTDLERDVVGAVALLP
jgi:hypothetical protein